MFFNRSRKQLPDSENVLAGSVLAIVLSKLLYFIDEKTEAQGEKKSYRGSLCELVAELEPEPRSAPGPRQHPCLLPSASAAEIHPKYFSHVSGLKTLKISPAMMIASNSNDVTACWLLCTHCSIVHRSSMK